MNNENENTNLTTTCPEMNESNVPIKPEDNISAFVKNLKCLSDNVSNCQNIITMFNDNLATAQSVGISKTGTPISKLPGASKDTATDANLDQDGGNMRRGRELRDEKNKCQGYIKGVEDTINVFKEAFKTGAIILKPTLDDTPPESLPLLK